MQSRFVAFIGAIAISFAFLISSSSAISDDLAFTNLDDVDVPDVLAKAPGYTPETHLCSIQVYLSQAGRGGVYLRAGPGDRFPIIGRLPKIDVNDQYPSFQIIGSRNGWFLIRNPYQGGGQYGQLKRLYKGLAWLAPNLIGFYMEGYTLYSEPRIHSPVLLKLKDNEEEWSGSEVTVEQVHDCSGRFLDVTVRRQGGQRVRGWFAAICGNQNTSCGFGDEPVLVEERHGKLVSFTD